MPEEYLLLPKELRDKALKAGDMWGWKFQNVPEVVEMCRTLNIAILGGSVIFIFPKGVGELYWLQAHPVRKTASEDWTIYVERSCHEFLDLFKKLMAKANFKQEIIDWPYLKHQLESGVNVMEHLCFELYIIGKDRYDFKDI